MAKAIISAIRKQAVLRGSLLLTALELAHRASDDGVTQHTSYTLLAAKCHYSVRTAIRHVQRLIALGILQRQRFWQRGKWGINRYTFCIRWPRHAPAQMSSRDNMASTLPRGEKREKQGTLADKTRLERQQFQFLTPGSVIWEAVAAALGGETEMA